ncbi:MAG: CcdB family protein [Betaproteobacteria bacterium]|nr:CcdB family protein [Betaproteobacteria bacterium]
MARFDVYRNSGPHAGDVPFLLDVQSDLLTGLDTRVVVPLRRRDRFPASHIPERLCPVFEIDGLPCVLETPKLAAVPQRLLKARVGSLAQAGERVVGALDFLFHGY